MSEITRKILISESYGHTARIDRRKKVVIGHPLLGRGGSEATVMWLIEALKGDYDVTVVTTGGWDLAELNAYYGTEVHEDEVRVRIAPVPALVRSRNAAALRGACYQRFTQTIAHEYDIPISAYNLTDWGIPAIHFISDFSWHRKIREDLHPQSPGFIYRDSLLRKAYLGITSAYMKTSGRDVLHQDGVIANSRWSANLMAQRCGVACAAIVYPCVWMGFPRIEWADKEQAFVMIGRVAPEKQIERAITILDAVRNRGYAIRFHLCGHIGNDRYGRKIAALCRKHADWIIAEGRVSGARKAQILAHCRFGIQACGAEAFGISVAEMIKAGAIVFAPDDGGQAEILEHPDLLYQNEEKAVEQICAVLANQPLQEILCKQLAGRAILFDANRFIRDSRSTIEQLSARMQVCTPV